MCVWCTTQVYHKLYVLQGQLQHYSCSKQTPFKCGRMTLLEGGHVLRKLEASN